VPTISKASAASGIKEKAPPDAGSAEALLLALAVGAAVALALALAEALGLGVDVTLQFVGCGSSLRISSNGSANRSVGASNVV
jgi:hypothetical protein